jgi:Zn finger protein HypA/HybF involved in hydrogenase expression
MDGSFCTSRYIGVDMVFIKHITKNMKKQIKEYAEELWCVRCKEPKLLNNSVLCDKCLKEDEDHFKMLREKFGY